MSAAPEQHSAELEAARRELDAFVHSASHELRAPLRAIRGFAAALEEDCGPQLDREGRDHLRRIHAGVERMTQMLDGLLSLSRLVRAEMTLENVQVGALARAVAQEVSGRHPQCPVQWRIAELPPARADRRLVQTVLEQLLENAVKFSAKRARADVSVEGVRQGAENLYRVRDNGVGFDPAQADKLFTPFFRLHAASEYRGAGLGLAAVRRVVERHGGRVRAEGRPGEGATFFFTLPAAAAEASA